MSGNTMWLVYYKSQTNRPCVIERPCVIALVNSEKEANLAILATKKYETKEGWPHDSICCVPIKCGINFLIEGGDGAIPL